MSFWRGRLGRLILVVAGIYYLFCSLIDQTMYDWATNLSRSDPFLVFVGTFVSAIIPAVFAFACLRQGLLPASSVVRRFERALRSSWFWYSGGMLGIVVGLSIVLQRWDFDPMMILSFAFGLLLVAYGRSVHRPMPASSTAAW